jgi:PKD repeat protein
VQLYVDVRRQHDSVGGDSHAHLWCLRLVRRDANRDGHQRSGGHTVAHSSVQAAAKPIADFSYSPTSPTIYQEIRFTAEKSTAAAGRQIVSYIWDFGSGRTGREGRDIEKEYDVPGTYVVTLTVTDDAGEKGVAEKVVTVLPLPGPTAVLSFSPLTPGTSTTVYFDASASTAPSVTPITSYSFNFGDGTGIGPVTTPNVTHTFSATGTYVVRLTVTDGAGRTGTTTVSVPVITVSPTAVLTFSPQDPKATTTVIFDATASSAPLPATIASYAFTFGDGTSADRRPHQRRRCVCRSRDLRRAADHYGQRGRSATTTATVTVKP